MNVANDELLKAIELALADAWDATHRLVQDCEANATASWIHAVRHKIEGDRGNSRHGYFRAGQLDHIGDELRAELGTIKSALTGHTHT